MGLHGATLASFRVRKISPQEVRAYKRIYRRGRYKVYGTRAGIFATSFLVLIFGSYFYYNFAAFEKQLSFNENKNISEYTEKKIEVAERAVAGTTVSGSSFVASELRLEIPKLNIIGNLSYPKNQKELESALDSSIAHIPQSNKPGEIGTTVFTAHSSSTKWGYYSNIFSTLNRLEKGDMILVYEKDDIYVYRVYNKQVIAPRLENLNYNKEEQLILTTCWPLGTTEKRLAVYAEKV